MHTLPMVYGHNERAVSVNEHVALNNYYRRSMYVNPAKKQLDGPPGWFNPVHAVGLWGRIVTF